MCRRQFLRAGLAGLAGITVLRNFSSAQAAVLEAEPQVQVNDQFTKESRHTPGPSTIGQLEKKEPRFVTTFRNFRANLNVERAFGKNTASDYLVTAAEAEAFVGFAIFLNKILDRTGFPHRSETTTPLEAIQKLEKQPIKVSLLFLLGQPFIEELIFRFYPKAAYMNCIKGGSFAGNAKISFLFGLIFALSHNFKQYKVTLDEVAEQRKLPKIYREGKWLKIESGSMGMQINFKAFNISAFLLTFFQWWQMSYKGINHALLSHMIYNANGLGLMLWHRDEIKKNGQSS